MAEKIIGRHSEKALLEKYYNSGKAEFIAIVLLWLEDLPYDEIGQILGISAKNVSVRLVRIREQMKKMD